MSTLFQTLPVFWMDVYKHGAEEVVEIQRSELPVVGARVSDLVSVLNEKLRSVAVSEDAFREVVYIQLYAICVAKNPLLDILIPGHFGGYTRLIAMTNFSRLIPHLVYVKLLTGRTIEVKCSPAHSNANLKRFVQDQELLSPDIHRLIYDFRQLEDEDTLQYDNIQQNSTLRMVLALPPFHCVDVSANAILSQKKVLSRAPQWRRWRKCCNGLNIEGICKNRSCAAFDQMVVYNTVVCGTASSLSSAARRLSRIKNPIPIYIVVYQREHAVELQPWCSTLKAVPKERRLWPW